jgi:hypothetical protein
LDKQPILKHSFYACCEAATQDCFKQLQPA